MVDRTLDSSAFLCTIARGGRKRRLLPAEYVVVAHEGSSGEQLGLEWRLRGAIDFEPRERIRIELSMIGGAVPRGTIGEKTDG